MRARARSGRNKNRVVALSSILALLLGGLAAGGAPAAANTLPWCEPGPPHEGTTVGPGDSIQAAIDAAAPGLIICVEPGTYVEDLRVDVDGIILWSIERHEAEIQGTVEIDADAVHLDSFRITSFSQSPAPHWSGVLATGGEDVIVSNNVIDGGAVSPSAADERVVGIENGGAEMLITDNVIEDAASAGIRIDTDLGTTVATNIIRGNDEMLGIEVLDHNVFVWDNVVEGSHVGVVFWAGAENGIVRANSFTGNDFGVVNADGAALDARENWWGSPTGPSGSHPAATGDAVWGNVDVILWCVEPDCLLEVADTLTEVFGALEPAPEEEEADPGPPVPPANLPWCEPGPPHEGTRVGPGESIQDAIDGAEPGLIICVDPGTYVEDLRVHVEHVILWSTVGHAAQIQGSIVIEADGVQVDSFTVTSFSQTPAPHWSGFHVADGVDVIVSSNLIDGQGVSPTGADEHVSGVRVDTGLGTTIEGNIIRGVATGGVEVFGGNVVVVDNDFEDNNVGLIVWAEAGGTTVRSNSFTGNDFGAVNVEEVTLDARENWWGSATGPSHQSNPVGTGDRVWGNVELFPWCVDPDCSM